MRKRASNMHSFKNLSSGVLSVLALILLLASPVTQAVELVTYYHLDALGSPIAATDEQGALLWKEAYRPYGDRYRQEDGSTNDLWYTGKPREAVTGLDYFGARWYDPTIGRFMGIDPAPIDPVNIHSVNRYAYANNNPYRYVDPDGRAAETALDVISLGLSISAFNSDPSLINGLGVAYDSLATVVPFLPAGFGIIKNADKVTKGADKLNPKLIQENPRNLIPTQTKSEMSGSQVKRLTKDMKQNGFDQGKPVDAWRNPNTGRLEIQDGHHRTEAARKAGLDKIPVQVWE